MELRRCGNSELRLSALGVGAWAFGGGDYWGEQDQNDVDRVVHRAVELGINYFDTAEMYNDGRSEASLGKAIRDLDRDKVIVGSKISPNNVQPKVLIEHCEATLRRLGLEWIDLYMVHWPITPEWIRHFGSEESLDRVVEDAFDTLCRLQEQGKIRSIGVSNFAPNKLEEAQKAGAKVVVNELAYSLLSRAIEYEILPFCAAKGIGVIGYSPLQQGLLSDKFIDIDTLPPVRRRTRHFDSRKVKGSRHGGWGAEAELKKILAEIRDLSRALGRSTSQVALRWSLANPLVTCVLIGCRNLIQLEANAAAAEEPLDQDTLKRLNEITAPLKDKLGSSFDYFESAENDRTR